MPSIETYTRSLVQALVLAVFLTTGLLTVSLGCYEFRYGCWPFAVFLVTTGWLFLYRSCQWFFLCQAWIEEERMQAIIENVADMMHEKKYEGTVTAAAA